MYALGHGARFTRRIGASAHRRIGASVLLALVACLSQADLHLVIPSDGPLPLYFSSTNARISARAWVSGTSDGIESFEIKLNGFPVYGKAFDPQQGELPSGWRAHVMFDSTHWGKEMTTCVVRLEAKEVGQPEQNTEVTIPIKNKAAGYILSHFVATGDSLTPTMDALEKMGYVNQAEVSAPNWTASQCLGDIAGCTVFYVASHGHFIQPGKSYFSDGTAGANEVPPGMPVYSLVAPGSSNEVKPVRETAVGTNLEPQQLPPFNPTGNPPIAFAWVDSCNTALLETADEYLKGFCYPERNKYMPEQIENQAEMGWDSTVPNVAMPVFAGKFWSYISEGSVAQRARTYALQDTDAWHREKYNNLPFTPTPRLFGDHTTRLRFVYTGFDDIDPKLPYPGVKPWHRTLSEGQP
ncbi:MAG: hypothetical protein IT207_10355 [Fimbriimonadaceae bacterium]|nr:hypothetical protein [Fimbriimonadaceae bacterium]